MSCFESSSDPRFDQPVHSGSASAVFSLIKQELSEELNSVKDEFLHDHQSSHASISIKEELSDKTHSWENFQQQVPCESWLLRNCCGLLPNHFDEVETTDLKEDLLKIKFGEDTTNEEFEVLWDSFLQKCLSFITGSLAFNTKSPKYPCHCSMMLLVECPKCWKCFKGTADRLKRLVSHVMKCHSEDAPAVLEGISKRYYPIVPSMQYCLSGNRT